MKQYKLAEGTIDVKDYQIMIDLKKKKTQHNINTKI